uniref:Uncharacterized protein n=1 Tax=Esox lucius TaxID=8010 RepID=A0A3P8XCI4_ESOLU
SGVSGSGVSGSGVSGSGVSGSGVSGSGVSGSGVSGSGLSGLDVSESGFSGSGVSESGTAALAPPTSPGSSQLWPLLGSLAGSYLIGPWPQDGSHAHHTPCMRDKATQTPRAWADERRRGSHKRSASCGSTDQLKEVSHSLQTFKLSSSQMANKTILIPIPISKATPPRFRNSLEGLNQEIERIIIRDTTEQRDEVIIVSRYTHTPKHTDTHKHTNLGPCSPLPKYAASPKPNNSYMFKREPPEGCEKVKVFEESIPLQDIPPFLCPDRNKVNFIPKSGSAFCLVSILKPLLPAPELSFRSGVGLRSMSPSMMPLGGVESSPVCFANLLFVLLS